MSRFVSHPGTPQNALVWALAPDENQIPNRGSHVMFSRAIQPPAFVISNV